MRSAVRELKNRSPGCDDMHNSFLRNMNEKYMEYLIKVMNKRWREECWKVAILISILKPTKPKEMVNLHRPMSMLLVVVKLMEKAIAERLKWYAEKCGGYSETQFGFRKTRSRYDSLTMLDTEIRKSLYNKKTVIVIVKTVIVKRQLFLGLEGAFDQMWHLGLLLKLKKMGLRGCMLGWLQSYLTGRVF